MFADAGHRDLRFTIGTYVVEGQILDDRDAPVGDVTVFVMGPMAALMTTDDEGNFRLEEALAGIYRIHAMRPHHEPGLVEVEVGGDGPVAVGDL